jgi:hypothetical protein
MVTRSEILDTLVASQETVTAYFQGLSLEELERPCTRAEFPVKQVGGRKITCPIGTKWAEYSGIAAPHPQRRDGSPRNPVPMSSEQRLTMANQHNQSWVNAHRDDSMETLTADSAAARQETLTLLEQFADEQLAALASLSFVHDRTAGDLFAASAQHPAAHITWIEESFRHGV